MIVIPQDQIDQMNLVMDYILKHPGDNVSNIREKYNISIDEYNMIYDLCMPHIRVGNSGSYWKTKYVTLRNEVSDRIRKEKVKGPKNSLASDIWNIIEESGVGNLNPNKDELSI